MIAMAKLSKLSKDQYFTLLQSCAEDCPSAYCFFKIFLEAQHPDPRIICQFKCVEIFKWEESEKAGKDIGLHEAGMRWVQEGWAAAFAKVYEEGEKPREIYTRTKATMIVQNSQASKTSTSEVREMK